LGPLEFFSLPISPLQELKHPLLQEAQVQLWVKRLDLLHKDISGNKVYKLFPYLREACASGHPILSFGGAFSNHIHALAAAGHRLNIKTIGVIRGEKPKQLSPTLQDALHWGMELRFVSRKQYRDYREQHWRMETKHPMLIVPEGGCGSAGVESCEAIYNEIHEQSHGNMDEVCCASATGGMATGLAHAMGNSKPLNAYLVLPDPATIKRTINSHESASGDLITNINIIDAYHFGGYAKTTPELFDFITSFKKDHHIQLEPTYTGKFFYGIFQDLAKGRYPKGSRIVAIHSGGLQGLRGYKT
jgi:1-aminocyclopropane-1-carboxylate deaminase/D-cysteine desulfhydrase-like pyridoxal-dependent ACC family enzyme